jgi:DNA-binding MarR family transcriptional regulator
MKEKCGERPSLMHFRSQSPLRSCQKLADVGNYVNMTDINGQTGDGRRIGGAEGDAIRTPLAPSEDIDFALIELLFFAYRDFTSDPDAILASYGFGRAHHRVLHFVNRMPGLTVAELLDVLRITKQSLARVLKQLIDAGYVVQLPGPRDRRQRELYPTARGRRLALALAAPQSRRIGEALRALGPAGRRTVETFLRAMVNPDLRPQIDSLPAADAAAEETGARDGRSTAGSGR